MPSMTRNEVTSCWPLIFGRQPGKSNSYCCFLFSIMEKRNERL